MLINTSVGILCESATQSCCLSDSITSIIDLFCVFNLIISEISDVSVLFVIFLAGLNLSSIQPPDNRTIQNFVKVYVDEYVGGYAVASHVTVLFG